jgi:cell surface protein SprA
LKSVFVNIVFFAALASVWPFIMLKPVTKQRITSASDLYFAPPDTGKKDSTTTLPFPFNDQGNKSGVNQGYESGMYLHKPSNITTEVEYDAENNEYNINENIGSLRYRTPESMSFEDYQKEDFDRAIKGYWRQRFQGENFQNQSHLIPQIRILGDVFNTIFGSSTIDIKPQGSAELIFGLNTNRTDNPQLPVKQRKVTTFDFQEKIQMNVTGQIGDKLKLSASYNTEASFEFENNMKLAYEGKEDEIIRKIEAGNVSLPLTGSLINGSYSLFGIKTELQFGKLTVTNIFSQQKGKSQVVEVQGGAQISNFEVYADQYEANRHFFLGKYFYDNYDNFLASLPLINSGINISRIEVWVTNKSGNYTDARNVVAFTDLGEGMNTVTGLSNIYNSNVSLTPGYSYPYPADTINSLNHAETTYDGIRTLSSVNSILSGIFSSGTDYNATESMRMLSPSEYTIFPTLGYISLNSALNSDEVLAVAYEYTVGGKNFKVGEFSNTIASPNALILKLIKGTSLTPQNPMWHLMMKNIYSIGAYQVNSEDFKLDVMYQNDKTGTAINFVPVGAIDRKPLIEVLNLDRLNSQLDPYPDGRFDFIDKVTINSSNGRVIFPVKEPFGNYLYDKMVYNDPTQATLASQFSYQELYDSTQSKARQLAEKNKFFMKGSYKSASGSDIALNAMNIPQGSVKVTAGGQILVENQDYTVDYTLGRVKIINQGLLQSGTPIKISLESQSLFNIQSKTLMGMHLNYQVNKDFSLGATILNLTERPLTQKVGIGDEPISNTIWGLDGTYRTESRLITKIVDKLPFLETKAASNFMVTGEFAHLIPGHSKAIAKNGISYIDDFEGSKSSIDLRSVSSWVLASTPQGQPGIFAEGNLFNNISVGYNRAKTAWYVIDPSVFYRETSVTPSNISADLTNHLSREVYEKEIWPNKEQQNGVPSYIPILNFAFYPEERGPYNYDYLNLDALTGKFTNPTSRWGGIMRKIESNDFEAANIEFVEFWLMDPFKYETDSLYQGGNLYFNLGDISEDVLRDGRKSFENGLPTTSTVSLVDTTVWGRVPVIQSVVNAFDNQVDSRPFQDVGLDGLSNTNERSFFSSANPNVSNAFIDSMNRFYPGSVAYQNAYNDPSSDDYRFYRGSDYDSRGLGILDRYKDYNGLEVNSLPTELSPESYPNAATTQPNTEDINRDNTLSEFESYFQYKIQMRPDKLQVGQNYIVDEITGQNKNGDPVKWYQFKVPLYKPDTIVGNIQDFKSIRFFRMFLKGFEKPVILRFAKLELVRGEWRKYNTSLLEGGPALPVELTDAAFDISAVNIEENGSKSPINYVLPPDVDRVIDPTNPQLRQLNEQALVLKACALEDGDGRAAYRNVTLDVRQYKRLQMYVHAEAMLGLPISNNDVCVFIRIGSDYQNNFYEYEIPLAITPPGSYNNDDQTAREIVWPESNMFDFPFEDLQRVKQLRNSDMRRGGSDVSLTKLYDIPVGNNRVSVVGNPNLSNIRTIMIGIRNRKKTENNIPDDGMPKCIEVWVNELRLTDFDEKGGWAANLRMSAKLADFGTVTVSGSTSTPGFGSIEKKVNERSKEQAYQYDIASNFELGKFLPEKVKLSIPMFIGFSEGFRNPQYNPLDPDIPLKISLADLESKEQKDSLRKMVQDYTRRKSLNFTNVKLNSTSSTPAPWDVSNFAVSYSYSEQFSRNISTIFNRQKMYRGALTYNYNTTPKNVVPFQNSKFLNKPLLKLIKDFNFNYLPSQFSFMTDVDRTYNEVQLRNIENMSYTIPTTYTKDFQWNRIYDFKYDITKSLKFDFSANNIAKIDEPIQNGQRVDKDYKEEYQLWKDSVWKNVQNFGRTTNYRHNFNLNYTIPINKIPILNWLTASARYGGTYEWIATPRFADESINLGNTIKNSNTRQINGQANMLSLYNKLPVLQRINQKYAKGKKPTKKQKETVIFPKQGDPPRKYNFKAKIPKSISHKLATIDVTIKITDSSGADVPNVLKIVTENRVLVTVDKDIDFATVVITGQKEKEDNFFIITLEQTARLLMCVKNITVTYSDNSGTVLPGYKPNTNILGMESKGFAPGVGFISGFQDTAFGSKAANDHRWVTDDTRLNAAYLMNNTKTLNIRATIEPLSGMRIDVTGNRTFSENNTRYYTYDSLTDYFSAFGKQVTGSFSMTYNTWNTTFEKFNDDYSSNNFQHFKDYRIAIARRLAAERAQSSIANSTGYIVPSSLDEFPEGYGPTSQEVLIPAFLAAYSGKSPDRISLTSFPGITSMSPNWSINYGGLTKIKILKKYFRTITLAHAYRSSYSVNSFSTSLDYNLDEFNQDGFSWTKYTLGNFIPQREINAVSISEQFSPLISIDATMINSVIAKFELKRSRNLSFGLNNNQITEMQSKEFIFGTGYRYKDLTLQFVGGKTFKSDLNLRADLSIRTDYTIIHKLEITTTGLTGGYDQLTAGQKMLTLNFTADYQLGQNFNLQIFYKRNVRKPKISTSYDTYDTKIGVSVKFTLSQ